MAVLLEAVSVVVRRDAIDQKVPGGWNQFVAAVPNATLCYDDCLARVAFMANGDAGQFLSHLQALGLKGPSGPADADVAVVDQAHGLAYEVPWLGVGRFDSSAIGGAVLVGYLKGVSSSERSFVAPGWWRYEGSLSQSLHRVDDAASAGLKFVRKDERGVDVYWDEKAGREVYSASPYGQRSSAPPLDAEKAGRREQLLAEADALAHETKVGELLPPRKAVGIAARKIRRAIGLYEKAVETMPSDWTVQWKRAKCLQALGEYEQSLDGFSRAWLLNPGGPDIAREAGISATEAGRHDAAIYYAQQALKLNAGDAGLRANLALAYLFAGNLSAATKEVDEAAAGDPSDAVTRAVRALVQEVAAGRMSRPARSGDIDFKAVQAVLSRS